MESAALNAIELHGQAAMAPPYLKKSTAETKHAGSEFVLESKGTWAHAGYHLASATAGPPLLSLPFAMASLGWGLGIFSLLVGALISFYASYLLSRVMEHMEAKGKRSLRYRDLANHVLGYNVSMKVIAPLQFMVCFIAIIAGILLGGETMKEALEVVYEGTWFKLYKFITIFGLVTVILSQIPSLHSLRYFNLLSTLLCLGFSICAFVGSIYAGFSNYVPQKDYSIDGTPIHKTFKVFNSLSIMISAYANPLIVEIQATLAPPTQGKMLKGLALCYSVALTTCFSVAISGYWAFGRKASGIVFNNMFSFGHIFLVPKALYLLGNLFACLQLIIITVLYLQPTFEKFEGVVGDANQGRFAKRNLLPRLVGRSLFVILATLFASMLPFFAEFSAFLGAFGFTPICIILPLLLYNLVFKSECSRVISCANYLIIAAAVVVVLLGSIASFRQIVINANTYRLFANLE